MPSQVHFHCAHSAPWAVWPAICPFSTMHCGIPLLNPGVKNEHVAITRALSSQKKSTPHSNWPSLLKPGWSFPQPIVLKEDGKVVVEGDKRIWPCANLPLYLSECVWVSEWSGHWLTRRYTTCKGELKAADHMGMYVSTASQSEREQPCSRRFKSWLEKSIF